MIYEKIKSDIIDSMKEHKSVELLALRTLLSDINNYNRTKVMHDAKDLVFGSENVSKTEPIPKDDVCLSVILKDIDMKKETIDSLIKAGKNEAVKAENIGLDKYKSYCPPALSDNEVENIVNKAIKDIGASSIKDMGKVLNLIKPQILGKYDMKKASNLVKSKF